MYYNNQPPMGGYMQQPNYGQPNFGQPNYGQPQMGYPQAQPGMSAPPMWNSGQGTPQYPFDPTFADAVIGQLFNELRAKQIPPQIQSVFQDMMNWRSGNPSAVSSVDRLNKECQAYLRSIGQDLSKSVPTDFIRKFLDNYIPQRIQMIQQRLFMQQQQQSMGGMGGYPQQPNMMNMGGYQQPQMGGQFYNPMAAMSNGWQGVNQPMGGMQGMTGMAPMGGYMQQSQSDGDYNPLGGPPAQTQQAPQQPSYNPQPNPAAQTRQPTVDPNAQSYMGSWSGTPQEFRPSSPSTPTPAPAAAASLDDLFDAPSTSGSITVGEIKPHRDSIDPTDASISDTNFVSVKDGVRMIAEVSPEVTAQGVVFELTDSVNNAEEAINVVDHAVGVDLREGEYLHLIDFRELNAVEIPTEAYATIRETVRAEFHKTSDWRALLAVMDGAMHKHTRALDKFLTAQINRLLLKHFRASDDPVSAIKIGSLYDLEDLMAGQFGSPQKDIKDWKNILNSLMTHLIDRLFVNADFCERTDTNLSDIIRSDEVKFIDSNGINKYDLAFIDTEAKNAWLDEFFAQYTVVRVHRTTAITNALNASEAQTSMIYSQDRASTNKAIFWSMYDAVVGFTRTLKGERPDSLFFYKDKDWSVKPGHLLSTKAVIYPITVEGVNKIPLILTPSLYYGQSGS